MNELNQNFGINPERILFLNPRDPNDPWIPADELESIARQTDRIEQISVMHDKYIPETGQVIYTATVVNKNGVTFTHPGVAKVGETPNGYDIEADVLAGGRALSAALKAAGIHPYRSGSVVDIGLVRQQVEAKNDARAVQEESRANGLRQLHAVAEKKKLKVGTNDIAYRMWLQAEFGVKTAVGFDSEKLALAIDRLNRYENPFDGLPQEVGADSMAA